jgi:hypothetical protein
MKTTYTAVYYGDENTNTFKVTLSSSDSSTTENVIVGPPQNIYNDNSMGNYYNTSDGDCGHISTTFASDPSDVQIDNKGYIGYTIDNFTYSLFTFAYSTSCGENNYVEFSNKLSSSDTETYTLIYVYGFSQPTCVNNTSETETTNVSFNFTTNTVKETYTVNITTTLTYSNINCSLQEGTLSDLTDGSTYITTYSFSYASSSTTQVTIEIYTEYNGTRLVPTKIKYTNNSNTTDSGTLISPIAFLCIMFYGISYDSYKNQSSGGNQTGNNEAHSIENCIIIQQMLAPLYTNFISTI